MTQAHSTGPLRAAIRADFRAARWRRRLALLAVLGWLAYEWGAGNETLTPWVLAKVIKETEGVVAIPVTAAVGMGLTTLQQLASGFTALMGFSMFDRTADAAWNRLRKDGDTAPGEWSRLSWPKRAALVFALGSTAVALVQIMSTGRTGTRRHARAVLQSATLCGALVGTIGGVAASLAVLGRHVHALRGSTEWVLRVLGNPLFWIAILVIGVLGNSVRRKRVPTPAA